MLNSLRDHIPYDTNIANYQMKKFKWLKFKVGRIFDLLSSYSFDATIENIIHLKRR